MAGKIPDETLQAIRERVSIVEVVSGYVTLRKAGRNHVGLCPFHAEKTPSFTVSDERGLFHCFGCGAGGTVFTFLMRADHVGFPEAVEALARRAGITLPARTETGPGRDERQRLMTLNELAQRYFRTALAGAAGAPARRYLQQRGVNAATAERYGLGFCPGGGGLARALASLGEAREQAAQLGLLGRRSDGSLYDRFWGRVTFPIRDGSGRILGFGGRTLGSDPPKYLNSPESALFHKGQVLYGLFEAREAVRQAGRVVIVEGYLDALALVEAGIGHTVASLGTALTAAQLRLARRFASEVVAFFDGDRAGQQAAVRAFGVCAEADVWGFGSFLPEGFDPDTYVRGQGAAATRALLEQAIPLWDFFLQRLDPGPSAGVPERARVAEQVAQVIARFRSPFQFDLMARQAAQRLGVDESVFRRLRTAGTGGGAAAAADAAGHPDAAVHAAAFRPEESTLIEAMALDREAALLAAQRGVLEAFESVALAGAGRAVVAAWERGDDQAARGGAALDALPAEIAERVTAGLLGEGAVAAANRLQMARDCIARIERRRARQRSRAAITELRHAEARGDDADLRRQLAAHNALIRGKAGTQQ